MLIRSLSHSLAIGLLVAAPALPLSAHASTIGASLTGNAGIGTVLGDVVVSTPSVDATGTADVSATAGVSAEASSSVGANDTAIVVTRADLETDHTKSVAEDGTRTSHVRAVLAADTRINSVELSPKQVSVAYRVSAKLFGFISLQAPLQVTVHASGTTTISYPWYGFLLTGNQAGLAIRAQAAAQSVISTSTESQTISPETQVTLLDSLTAALQAEESSKS